MKITSIGLNHHPAERYITPQEKSKEPGKKDESLMSVQLGTPKEFAPTRTSTKNVNRLTEDGVFASS